MNRRFVQLSSGVFLAPELPAGIRPSLRIMFSNFAAEKAEVEFVVHAIGEAGAKRIIRKGTLELPGDHGTTIELSDQEIEGERLDITMRLPRGIVVPSATIVETALADGSTSLALLIGPSEFTRS